MFIDARMPVGIERGASGGPTFNTTVHTLASGREQRNQNWSHPQGKWDVSYGIRNMYSQDSVNADRALETVMHFFYLMKGKANSFRFRDWSDYIVSGHKGSGVLDELDSAAKRTASTNLAEKMARDDTHTLVSDNAYDNCYALPLTKRYNVGSVYYYRPITQILDRLPEQDASKDVTAYSVDSPNPNAVKRIADFGTDPLVTVANNVATPISTDDHWPLFEAYENNSWRSMHGQIRNNVDGSDSHFMKTATIILPTLYGILPNRWTGYFDCHVRFNTDSLNVSLEWARAGNIPDIPLIELRS